MVIISEAAKIEKEIDPKKKIKKYKFIINN